MLNSCGNADLASEGLCLASNKPTSVLLNYNLSNVRTPRGSINSTGDGEPIIIGDPLLRRDICALKGINDQVIEAYRENDLKFWLYAGTTNKAFLFMPGKPICRDTTDDPLRNCGYDPTVRPWFINAASGPKDIVFLFDATSLTSEDSILRSSLRSVLRGLDPRDYVALVAFNSENTAILGGADGLRGASEAFVNGLVEDLDALSAADGFPDVIAAIGAAYDLLEATNLTETSRQCAKLIVLMSGSKEEKCFSECPDRPVRICPCTRNSRELIGRRQSSPGPPARIVSFSENQTTNGESLSRSLACLTGGIWRRITNEGSDSNALSTFTQTIDQALFDDNPEVFTSQLYEDSSGLGSIMTLSVPIYDREEQRLIGVAGADITLNEVIEAVGSEEAAREQITVRSNMPRTCTVPRDQTRSCELQGLRSQPGSGICPARLPIRFRCLTIGNTRFFKSRSRSQYTKALEDCESFGDNATLAIIDGAAEIAFVASFSHDDGSWIGIRAKIGERLKWINGSDLLTNNFARDGNEEAARVHREFNTDACVISDQRGVTENWSVLPCNYGRRYICRINSTSEVTPSRCEEEFVNDVTEYTGRNPINCTDLSPGIFRNCSEEQDKDLEAANPLCPQSGLEYTEADRTCCGGRSAPNIEQVDVNRPVPRMNESDATPTERPTETSTETSTEVDVSSGGRAVATGGIIGIVLGVLAVVVFVVVVAFVLRRRKRVAREVKEKAVLRIDESTAAATDNYDADKDLSRISLDLPLALRKSLHHNLSDGASSIPSGGPRRSEETDIKV